MRVKVCVCVCITIKCVVYKHERQKVKRYYPDDLIAKRIERKGKKVQKRCHAKTREAHTNTSACQSEKREKKVKPPLFQKTPSFSSVLREKE